MTAVGCYRCGENQHRIRRLLREAARAENCGKPVGDLREQVRTVQEERAACAAGGHMIEASKRGGAIKNGHVVPTR